MGEILLKVEWNSSKNCGKFSENKQTFSLKYIKNPL